MADILCSRGESDGELDLGTGAGTTAPDVLTPTEGTSGARCGGRGGSMRDRDGGFSDPDGR